MASTQLINFFWTLESVLSYRATIIKVFEDMGRFTVNKVTLSTKDVLVLLYKWSLIAGDRKLQGDLKAVVEQYQIKDLMSKFQPAAPGCLGPHGAASIPPLATVAELMHHRDGNGDLGLNSSPIA